MSEVLPCIGWHSIDWPALGELHHVRLCHDSQGVWQITLGFAQQTLHLSVNEDAELVITASPSPQDDELTCHDSRDAMWGELSSGPLAPVARAWEEAISCRVRRCLLMINQQGYDDGLDFEFVSDARRDVVHLQLRAEVVTISLARSGFQRRSQSAATR